MQSLKAIKVPIIADYVLSPIVIYNDDFTSINIETEDEQYGRITFQNLDAIKMCRGEMPPYEDEEEFEMGTWVYKVENSLWLQERYTYEKKHYENNYEWGNSVEEMLTDYSHYFFRFHDEFVEAIAKGFWYEKGTESFVGKPLSKNHPFLPFENDFSDTLQFSTKEFYLKFNIKSKEELINDSTYYRQKLIEIWSVYSDEYFNDGNFCIKQIDHEIITFYQPTFGRAEIIKKGWSTIEELKIYLKQKYHEE